MIKCMLYVFATIKNADLFHHSFKKYLIGCSLCAKHCPGCWRYSSEENRQKFCFHRADILELKTNKINTLNVYALEMKMKEKTKQGEEQEVLEEVWISPF